MLINCDKHFSLENFKNPGNKYAIVYSWVWNAPISKTGIDERLEQCAKAGIKGIYILPEPKSFRPDSIRTFLEPEYLSDEFFELVKYALDKADTLGMRCWLYDEGGWPSGGACWNTFKENPDSPMRILEKRTVKLAKGEKYKPEDHFVALFNEKTRLCDGFVAEDDTTINAYYAVPTIFNGNRADCTNASVTDTFIGNTYEAYKRWVGDKFDKIPLIFTDEPGMQWGSIAYNEFEIFKSEYGYDLRDYLYVIDGQEADASTEDEIKARIDHFALMGKLFRENTLKRIADWCEKNDIAYGGHLDLDNIPSGGVSVGYFSHLDLLRQMHVPGVDVIWEQIRYPYGARAPLDNETQGYGFYPRLAASAARQSGRNMTLSESMGVYGDSITPDEVRFVFNYQAIRGINSFNFMYVTYGNERCLPILMRPSFTSEKPGFYNLKHLNEYYERLCYLLRLGEREGDTALYHPSRDYAGTIADSRAATESYNRLGTMLEEKNIQFDIIDEYGILNAIDTGCALKIGNAAYRHIAVPENKYMPDAVKAKIEKYIGFGEPIYTPKSDKLRIMTRKVDNSRLWFIFNEGIEPVCEVLDIAGGKKLYRLDARSGEMYRENCADINLLCGDMAIYLVSDENYATVSDKVCETVEVFDFKIRGYDRFNIGKDKISSNYFDGAPDIDEGFSGTVYYEADYELPFTPKCNEKYRLNLCDFSLTARVYLDGEYACDLGMMPMWANIPEGMLKKSGKIKIALSNTASNEIIAKLDLISSFPEAEIGPYHTEECGEMTTYDRRRPKLKFGRVYIEKIERTECKIR